MDLCWTPENRVLKFITVLHTSLSSLPENIGQELGPLANRIQIALNSRDSLMVTGRIVGTEAF